MRQPLVLELELAWRLNVRSGIHDLSPEYLYFHLRNCRVRLPPDFRHLGLLLRILESKELVTEVMFLLKVFHSSALILMPYCNLHAEIFRVRLCSLVCSFIDSETFKARSIWRAIL